jgi:excisionase family DNA binding protein
MGDTKVFLTPAEVAYLLEISVSAVYHKSAGTSSLPRYRFGRLLRFKKADVDKFISDRKSRM